LCLFVFRKQNAVFLQVSVGKPSTQPCFFYSLAVSGVHL
jgi:hypothetical protein